MIPALFWSDPVVGTALREGHHGGSASDPRGVPSSRRGEIVATRREQSGGIGGISLGGILVIIGIVLMIAVSFWIGLIVTLVGLIAFGGFARGKWY
jgi:hypothetical protein